MRKVTDAKQLETLHSMERCIQSLLGTVTYVRYARSVTVLDRTVRVHRFVAELCASLSRWEGQGWTVSMFLSQAAGVSSPAKLFDFEGDWSAFERDVVVFRLALP